MPERGILGWLLIGLVAGVLGKFIMPGKDPGGFVVTILVGIAGALLAGFVAQTMNWTLVDDPGGRACRRRPGHKKAARQLAVRAQFSPSVTWWL